MHENKYNRPLENASGNNFVSKSTRVPSQNIFILLFFLILFGSIGLKIYKACHSGIIFEEWMNSIAFGGSLGTAIGNFSTTNNHVLNSIFMHYAQKFFSSFEHFIRIPSVLAGVLFSLSMAYIIYKTIASNALRAACLALVSLVPLVFDFSYLARGYAFALGGIYAAIAFVLWLLEHKIKFRYWMIPVLVISLTNLFTLGSMLSCLLLSLALNIVYVLFFSSKIYKDKASNLKLIILNAVSIFLVSFTFLFLLYRKIYTQIFHSPIIDWQNKIWKEWPSFVDYLHTLLIRKVFRLDDGVSYIIFYVIAGLFITSFIFYIYRLFISIKIGAWREYLKVDDVSKFMFLVTGLTIIIMFIYSVPMKRSLGLERSHVFFIPLALTSGIIILEKFGLGLGNNKLGRIVRSVIVILVMLIASRNLPSPYHIGNSTLSGPLLRKLKAIDPEKMWTIAFSSEINDATSGWFYYKQFDYKFNMVQKGEYNVFICHKDKIPNNAVCLDLHYYRKIDLAVVISQPLSSDKVVFEAQPKENSPPPFFVPIFMRVLHNYYPCIE